jgi:hypothetical protein
MEQRGWPAIPNGRAWQMDTQTGAQRRVDGRPMEGAQVLDREREWPNGRRDGCPTEGGVSGGCGNTDSNFFCSRPQISTKTGSLRFGNK